MFGVSDHDLMFAIRAKRAVEGDGDDDGNENDARFIQDKVWVTESVDCWLLLWWYSPTTSYSGRRWNIKT